MLDKVLVDAAVAAGAGFREEFTVDGLVWHDGRVVSSCGRSICAIFFRKPFGPGSALVGDAGQHMDACTAQGISAAFQDAETLAHAIDRSLAGGGPMDTAVEQYERRVMHRAFRSSTLPVNWHRSRRHRPRCSSCSRRCITTLRPDDAS